MKHFVLVLTAFLIIHTAFSQALLQAPVKRCATMLRVDQARKKNHFTIAAPATRPDYHNQSHSVTDIHAIIYIPVVVHIVLPNPYLVTDIDVQAQLDRLSLDFSGLNADSTNIPPAFVPLRGHSQIRFCLAKQTPGGQLTSGIERRASTTGSDIMSDRDPIKYTSDGGLDAWDPSKYLNYWVGVDATGEGVLGYAQFPMSTVEPASSDGVVINYQAWGTNPCYTYPSFNKGRTAVHETGHYFGLFHTWGDDGSACSGDDFADLTTGGSACALPTGLFNPTGQGNTANDVGDTPNQAGETNGCPTTSIVIDSCSKQSPGIMYQNLMDYSNDACLSLFTKKQVERMEWVLLNCRSGLVNSNGCQQPVNPVLLDVAPVNSVTPGGVESNGCNSIFYSSVLLCPGSIAPKVRVINNGLTTVTSLTVGYRLNNGTAVTKNVTVSLPLGATEIISFAPVPIPSGESTFRFFTAAPNGSVDQVPQNDTITQKVTVLGTATLPLQEGFEGNVFPPEGWGIDNYNNDFTWEKRQPGRNSTYSLFINNYDIDATENLDDLKSPRISVAGADSVIISFDLAHKTYPDEGFSDTLTVLVTKDCGATFQTVYKKWGNELATAGSSNDPYDNPAPGDWRTERFGFTGQLLSTGQISVIFRNSTRYGNNIFIDNINIEGKKANTLLRLKGYLILPTVFTSSFNVWYQEPPDDLKGISVYNSMGQLVYSRQFAGTTDRMITVDLTGKAAGAYLVRLSYKEPKKDKAQWVIKQQ